MRWNEVSAGNEVKTVTCTLGAQRKASPIDLSQERARPTREADPSFAPMLVLGAGRGFRGGHGISSRWHSTRTRS